MKKKNTVNIKTREEVLLEEFQTLKDYDSLDKVFHAKDEVGKLLKRKVLEAMETHSKMIFVAKTEYNQIMPDSFVEEVLHYVFSEPIFFESISPPLIKGLQALKKIVLSAMLKYSAQDIEYVKSEKLPIFPMRY